MREYQVWREAALGKVRDKHRPALIPQPGFQYKFLSSKADIVLGGGSAGGGKTYALLMEAARYSSVPGYSSLIFRRTMPQIKNVGGLWHEAKKIYAQTLGGYPKEADPLSWNFPTSRPGRRDGASVVFNHLQYDSDKINHSGGQYPLICFDELTTFLADQFWFLLSRNRTMLPVKPYVRATCNPETSGWVKDLVSWYIYPDDYPDESKAGYPIEERDGVIRYFFRDNDTLFWGNTPLEVVKQVPHIFTGKNRANAERAQHLIKSFTFIKGDVYQNKALMANDPAYIGNLYAQNEDDKNRLLHGCWKYRPGGEELFNYNELQDFFTNDFVKPGQGARERYITADIALDGSDLFVVMVWDGMRLIKCKAYEKTSGKTVLETLKQIARQFGVPYRNIAFDANGAGGFLTTVDGQGSFLPGAFSFKANNRPLKERGTRGMEVPNYENLKAQCAYMASQMLARAKMYAVPGAIEDWMRERLIQECMAHLKRDYDKEGKKKISKKHEVRAKLSPKRSPDFFDAFIMRMVFLLHRPGVSRTA